MILALALLGCNDNNLVAVKNDAIALVDGDFDDIGATLLRNDIGSEPYNGYINQSTTFLGDPGSTPPSREDPGRTVEALFTEPAGDGEHFQIDLYNAVFINSGTRGLNAFRYDYTLDADDTLLTDPTAMNNVCAYAQGSHSLFVTDWAYDLVENCWPDAIEFANDDKVVDDAQVGNRGDVLADVVDEDLATALGSSVANVVFNYTAFAVMEDVGADTEVLLRGDVSVEPLDGGKTEVMKNVPLVVRFPVGSKGQVVFSSFHMFPQTPALADAVLFRGMTGLTAGDGAKSSEAVQ